jgi:hypothetical protein
MHEKFWLEILKERNHLSDLYTVVMTILKWTLRMRDGRVMSRFIWLWIETEVGCSQHGNERPCSIKYSDFFTM